MNIQYPHEHTQFTRYYIHWYCKYNLENYTDIVITDTFIFVLLLLFVCIVVFVMVVFGK